MCLETTISKITEELKNNIEKAPYPNSNYSYSFCVGVLRILFCIYNFLGGNRMRSNRVCIKARSWIYTAMLLTRECLILNQQGTFSSSAGGTYLKEKVLKTYNMPIHIVEMTKTLINTELGLTSLLSLGYYRESFSHFNGILGYIVVEEGLSEDRQAHTLIHELVHAKFQKTRSLKNPEQYAKNEVIAESVAYVISAVLGLTLDRKQSEDYIKCYLLKAKKLDTLDNFMVEVQSTVTNVLRYLEINDSDEHNIA